MPWFGWVAVAAALLAVAAVVLVVMTRRALRRRGLALWPSVDGSDGDDPSNGSAARSRGLVAFVANPTKPGVAALREAALKACASQRLPVPLWFETTVDDPGTGQARRAVEEGAGLVVAVGGDGTVRGVAEALVGTDVPMGLIPQGTGNLLARNLDLPLGDTDALLRIALTGTSRRIDVGWLTVLRSTRHETHENTQDGAHDGDASAENGPTASADGAGPAGGPRENAGTIEPDREHIFLVISGLGFDAAMVADADEVLKAKVGWVAYFVAGIKHLHARRMRLEISLDESPWLNVRLRTLLVGNCGKLPGGITLLPNALLDDGWLDVAAIDTKGGIVGWTQLFGEVALQRFGVRRSLPTRIGRIDHATARELRVRAREPQPIQVDGDLIGRGYELAARVDPLSLTVRVERTDRGPARPDADRPGRTAPRS
jgi:diacylglycerol kinase (ATP)